jgi:hypothetical protein
MMIKYDKKNLLDYRTIKFNKAVQLKFLSHSNHGSHRFKSHLLIWQHGYLKKMNFELHIGQHDCSNNHGRSSSVMKVRNFD